MRNRRCDRPYGNKHFGASALASANDRDIDPIASFSSPRKSADWWLFIYVQIGCAVTAIPFYDAAAVEALFDLAGGIAAMREAMIALSASTDQPLRQITRLPAGGMFAAMAGELASLGLFGAKLVSVFEGEPGRSRHRGIVAAFDANTGEISCLADAEAVTTLRTACATAAATDALARRGAATLAIFGCGTQARSHARALALVRDFQEIRIWGRNPERTRAFVETLAEEDAIVAVACAEGREAAAGADVICTVSSAHEPILEPDWLGPGVHVNLVGSSFLGPAEVGPALVLAARYIADYRPSALAQPSELAAPGAARLVDDIHLVAEIGEIFSGRIEGRQNDDQLTIYKSLGHVAQDLAAAAYIHQKAISMRAKI